MSAPAVDTTFEAARLEAIPDAHFGWQDNEQPVYGYCPACGLLCRLDRIDLVAEHQVSCSGGES